MPKVASPVWLKKRWFSQLPKKSPNSWATFVIIFFAKKYQKSPNLVTLDETLSKNVHSTHKQHSVSLILDSVKFFILFTISLSLSSFMLLSFSYFLRVDLPFPSLYLSLLTSFSLNHFFFHPFTMLIFRFNPLTFIIICSISYLILALYYSYPVPRHLRVSFLFNYYITFFVFYPMFLFLLCFFG